MDDITPYLDPLRIMQAGVEWERAKGQLRAFLAVQSTKRMFLPPGADRVLVSNDLAELEARIDLFIQGVEDAGLTE